MGSHLTVPRLAPLLAVLALALALGGGAAGAPASVTLAGDFQSELGCPGDWNAGCLRSWLEDLDGDGIFTFETRSIPVGTYDAKVTIGRSWDENYGAGGLRNGPNISFSVTAPNQRVLFTYHSS